MYFYRYIQEVRKQLVHVYGMKPSSENPNEPESCPDGEYPMTIDGKLDRVKIINSKIDCCNFEE